MHAGLYGGLDMDIGGYDDGGVLKLNSEYHFFNENDFQQYNDARYKMHENTINAETIIYSENMQEEIEQ